MTFAESYKQNLNKTQLLSKVASFLIAVILLVEVFSNFNDLFFSEYKWTEAYTSLLKIVTFQAIVGVVFAVRFILLFLNKLNSVFYSQIIWFIGWLTILIYFGAIFGFHTDSNSHIYYQLSIYKTLFATTPYFYFLLSPIHQILHLIIAFFHRKLTYAKFTF